MGFRLRVILFSLAFCLQYGCASYSKYPVDAELLDEPIKTTVDSAEAQYYLNHYLQGNRNDARLDQRIDAVYQRYAASFPERVELQQIAQQFSNDFAALYLADRLWQEQQNREVQRIFHDYLSQPEHELYAPPAAVEVPPPAPARSSRRSACPMRRDGGTHGCRIRCPSASRVGRAREAGSTSRVSAPRR